MHSDAQAHLAKVCPKFSELIARVGPRSVVAEDGREPYARLLRAIAHQQLHGRAAETIFGRFLALFPGHDFPPPKLVLERPDADLRACGFSFSKIAAIRDIAEKTRDGVVPDARAAVAMPDDKLIARLLSIRGVGRWTVEMLLINMGRPDVLPVDDFGVREGYRLLHALEAQPKPKALAELGLPWAPFRSTAAWYLWRAADEAKKIKPLRSEQDAVLSVSE
jgi:DNA-3-methyladenine glycosylase II